MIDLSTRTERNTWHQLPCQWRWKAEKGKFLFLFSLELRFERFRRASRFHQVWQHVKTEKQTVSRRLIFTVGQGGGSPRHPILGISCVLDVIVPTINIRRPAALLRPHIQYQSKIFFLHQQFDSSDRECSSRLGRQGTVWHVGLRPHNKKKCARWPHQYSILAIRRNYDFL